MKKSQHVDRSNFRFLLEMLRTINYILEVTLLYPVIDVNLAERVVVARLQCVCVGVGVCVHVWVA